MDSSRDSEFDARLVRIETAVAGLQRSVERLVSERGVRSPQAGAAEPARGQRRSSYSLPEISRPLPSWLASRDTEWWLSRVGMAFLILGILFLYGYAIDRGWITPVIRVFAGVAAGGVLVWIAGRVRPPTEATDTTDSGFRELLLGGALAIWYLTAYAAAVWYQLIPMPAARLVFLVLGIISCWIALAERRQIFAIVAVITGFATPFVLPAPAQSMTELSLYLGAVSTMGLFIYLLRGWQSIGWITFLAFWASVEAQIGPIAR